jgi:Rho GDP-dissociation inhibitor
MLAKVDKDEEKMGSFAPQEKEHVFDLPWQEAPSGFLARGDYKGKGLFLDNDGIVHCQFNYVMTIDKEW